MLTFVIIHRSIKIRVKDMHCPITIDRNLNLQRLNWKNFVLI